VGEQDPTMLVTPKIKVHGPAEGKLNRVASTFRFALRRQGDLSFGEGNSTARKWSTWAKSIGVILAGRRDWSRRRRAGRWGKPKRGRCGTGSLYQNFRGHKEALLCRQTQSDSKVLATEDTISDHYLERRTTGKPVARGRDNGRC